MKILWSDIWNEEGKPLVKLLGRRIPQPQCYCWECYVLEILYLDIWWARDLLMLIVKPRQAHMGNNSSSDKALNVLELGNQWDGPLWHHASHKSQHWTAISQDHLLGSALQRHYRWVMVASHAKMLRLAPSLQSWVVCKIHCKTKLTSLYTQKDSWCSAYIVTLDWDKVFIQSFIAKSLLTNRAFKTFKDSCFTIATPQPCSEFPWVNGNLKSGLLSPWLKQSTIPDCLQAEMWRLWFWNITSRIPQLWKS